MKDIPLKPILEPKDIYDAFEKELKAFIRKYVYYPLILELTNNKKTIDKVLTNSMDDLLDAIKSGQISFYRGQFTGNFNATLSSELRRLGATWDRKRGAFAIPSNRLPIYIRQAIDVSADLFEKKAAIMDKKLKGLEAEELVDRVKVSRVLDKSIYKVDKDFDKTLSKITVPPQITPEKRQRILKEYTANVKLKIRGWLEEEIAELRQKIEENVFAGKRYEGMIDMIEKRYSVSQSKAKFIASQETRLLVTKYKEIRYQDAGVNHYKWKCVIGSANHPVRKQHQKLNDESARGKLFTFDNPPIVTEPGQSVRRANPGEDYNCRCFAIPVARVA